MRTLAIAAGVMPGTLVRRLNNGKVETDSICFLSGGIINRVTRTLYKNGSVAR